MRTVLRTVSTDAYTRNMEMHAYICRSAGNTYGNLCDKKTRKAPKEIAAVAVCFLILDQSYFLRANLNL